MGKPRTSEVKSLALRHTVVDSRKSEPASRLLRQLPLHRSALPLSGRPSGLQVQVLAEV